ncbi:glutamate receptor ionotropic, kainate 2-like [Macrobrachium rosenbergii]|uniref:glutamate receptor ionotropic, kainate 2-like n=1 Tax=Macrobrachium rosenbergii TaxID=79674 RepID=UPI0034D44EFA
MVRRGEAALTSVFADTYERRQLVDFTVPLFVDESAVIYKRPELEPDIFGFVKPFTGLIWLLIFASSAAASLIFFILYLVPFSASEGTGLGDASSRRVRPQTSGWSKVITSLEKSVGWSLYCLLGQSVLWFPTRMTLRIALGVWLLITFIIGTVYRSTVKAMLILPLVRLPFDSIDQLVESKIDLVVFQGTALYKEISNSANGTKIGRLKPQLRSLADEQTLLDQVSSGKIAYGGIKIPLLHLMRYQRSLTGKCQSYMMTERLFKSHPIGLAITKGSPLKKKVDKIIRRLRESGILEQMLKFELKEISQCLSPISATISSDDIRQLSLKDFYGVFALYGAGLILATWVFVFEILLKMLKEEKR